MSTDQTYVIKSELMDDWHILWPVLQLMAIVVVIIVGIWVLRFVMGFVVKVIITIWSKKL